ncbi:GlxA family transcriptional regulator [Pseudomonas sp.]|uniref:GlxA family transcriptional regulator n=1 Tax=Pseudomonas sp. TaxID=306 RepID=UPI00273523FE|nr:helix-turn-helix domain-containing protein [Pseudomonas sp.]MDP3815973.1 DJ-1/PfpI family protein [Pseudomonas sp.]
MKRVTILILSRGLYSTVTGPLEVFQFAGVWWNHLTGQKTHPQFQVVTASIDGKLVTGAGGLAIMPQFSIEQITTTDLILVSSGGAHLDSLIEHNSQAIAWLQQWHRQGATIAGICTGVCLLAEAGLLDGKEATTHWGMAEEFRARYPNVDLRPDRLVVDAGSVLCAGGVNAALDLSLYLVEKYCGREIATQCAKSLLIETSRTSQAGFAVLALNKRHSDKAIMEAQDWIERNYPQNFTMEELASSYSMSLRSFMRRFKAATGGTPLAYLHQVRVSAAKSALETGVDQVEAISNRVGYEDVAFFRALFRRYTGITPKAYRVKFGTRATR